MRFIKKLVIFLKRRRSSCRGGAAAEKELAFNEKREAVKEMLSDGVSVNKIHKYLKLPIETITELQKEFNRENSDKGDDVEP